MRGNPECCRRHVALTARFSRRGTRGEEAYDNASYVTTLTIVQPQGVEPLPAPPPAKPN